jgi:hypothetical protein
MELVQKVCFLSFQHFCICPFIFEYKFCIYTLALNFFSPQVIGAIGGVNNAVCASFLSQLEVYDEEVGLVAKQNTQQHRCVLFPIANFLNSALILKIASGMNIANIINSIIANILYFSS